MRKQRTATLLVCDDERPSVTTIQCGSDLVQCDDDDSPVLQNHRCNDDPIKCDDDAPVL